MRKAALATLTISLLFTAGCAPVANETASAPEVIAATATPTPISTAAPSAPTVDKGVANESATAEQLAYLIEEEKLAHDVYTAMYELWGARAFGNILNSEANHQDQVLSVMNTFDVEDPRSNEVGVFTDPELQKLYDDLVAKGSKSLIDAYEVGVAIEELDIADLTEMLSTATDSSVIAMMENLRRGSENHLRAFNSKL
jgi:hypothetical protein